MTHRIEDCILRFEQAKREFQYFAETVKAWMEKCDTSHRTGLRDVYAVKCRIKDSDHLREKLTRKQHVVADTLFDSITDLAGIRILHLWPSQFDAIHKHIFTRIENSDWELKEQPKAYTWDPETRKFFEERKLQVEEKEGYYTSVHYVVRPNNKTAFTTCEIQVRSLLEEVWGEIDHSINYPRKTSDQGCADQLLVFAKLIGAGSKLISSIESAHLRSASTYFADTSHPPQTTPL